MGTTLIGAGLVGTGVTWLAKKAASAALNSAKTKATQTITEKAKAKAGELVFGKNIGEEGDLDSEDKVDFRGHRRYVAPKPTGIVSLFCGGSVIDADTLDKQLLEQAQKAYRDQNPGAVPAPQDENVGPAPKDAKVVKPVNEPISIDNFRTMVGTKGSKNKGYVRFAKCDGGQGVTLEKVGNKIGWLMNWRVNVTKEHNRQMRQLFAETLLDEFGGPEGLSVNGSKFGAVLDKKLADIRTLILNKESPGKLLKRADVKKALEIYDGLFGKESKEAIINSYLTECLKQCQYSGSHGNVCDNVKEFLGKYGSLVGVRDLNDLLETVRGAKTGAQLRAALEAVTVAFEQMNVYWQQDKTAMAFLETFAKDRTTAFSPEKDPKKLDALRAAVERRVDTKTWAVAEGRTLGKADVINQFFASDKVFATLIRSYRLDYDREIAEGHSEKEAGQHLTERLRLQSIVAEIEKFGAALNAELAKDVQKSPLQIIRDARQGELDGLRKTRLESATRMGMEKELAELDGKIRTLEGELAWLDEQAKEIDGEGEPKVLGELLSEKDLEKDPNRLRAWSKEALKAVLKDGYASLGHEFQIDLSIRDYLEAKCPGVENAAEKGVRKVMDKIVDDFKAVVTKALAANVKEADDISLSDLIAELGEYLMGSSFTEELNNDAAVVTDLNPFRSIANTRRKSPLIFVESVMRVSVEHALQQKVEKGVAYADVENTLKSRAKSVAGILSRLFEALAKDDSKIKGLKTFSADTKVYKQTGVIDSEEWKLAKSRFRDGAKQLLRIDLLNPFLDEDLPQLLNIEDGKAFEREAKIRLDARVNELLASFEAMNVEQFYTAVLHFDTTRSLEDRSMQTLFGVAVKDEETGFTNPKRVGEAFLESLEGLLNGSQGLLRVAKRTTFRPLADVEILPLVKNYAEDCWRRNVVAHAPGKYRLPFVNTLLELIWDFTRVAKANRQTDISANWLDNRKRDFTEGVTEFAKDYFAFEKKVVDRARKAVTAALKTSGNATFAGLHDPAARARLVDAVLGEFKAPLGNLLKRYLGHPRAMASLIKGGKLETLIAEAMGDVNAKTALAVDAVVRNHADLVARRVDDPETRSDVTDSVLKRIQSDEAFKPLAGLLGQKTGTDLVTWAVEHTLDHARQNPVETYVEDNKAFCAGLVERALKDLATVTAPYLAEIEGFNAKLDEAVRARSNDLKQTVGLIDYSQNAKAAVQRDFTTSFCNLALGRAKDKADYRAHLTALVAEKVAVFDARLAQAVQMKDERQVKAFETLAVAFDAARVAAEEKVSLKGVSMEVVARLRKGIAAAWDDVIKTFGEKMASVVTSQIAIDEAVEEARKALTEKVANLATDYVARIEKSQSALTKENLVRVLDHFGVAAVDYPNDEAYDAAIQFFLDDPAVVAFFAGMQEACLSGDVSVLDSDAWQSTFVPGFKAYYALQDNKMRVRDALVEIDDGLTRMTLDLGLSNSEVKQVRDAADKLTAEAQRTVLMVQANDVASAAANVDVAKLAAATIDVKAALDAAQAKRDEFLAAHRVELARADWLRENVPAVLEALCANREGLVVPANAVMDVAKMVEANRNSFRNALIVWMRDNMTKTANPPDNDESALPGIWTAKLAGAFGEPLGSKIPPEIQDQLSAFQVNFQNYVRSYEVEAAINKTVAEVQQNAMKLFFTQTLAWGTFDSPKTDGLRRYERLAAKINPLTPTVAVKAYRDLRAGKLTEHDQKTLDQALQHAERMERMLAEQMQTFREKLNETAQKAQMTFVANPEENAKATNAAVKAVTDGLKTESAGAKSLQKILQEMNEQFRKAGK